MFQNKQVLKLYGLKQHLKNGKSEKVKEIVRHSCLQQKSPPRAGQPTLRNARKLTQNDNRASADSSETDESDNVEYDSHGIDSVGHDYSSDLTLHHHQVELARLSLISSFHPSLSPIKFARSS